MSLWDDLLSGIGHFGSTVGNDVGNFVSHDVAPTIYNAADFINRDIRTPMFQPLDETASRISDLIDNTDEFEKQQQLQDQLNAKQNDLPLLAPVLSAPANFFGKGILEPSFQSGTDIGQGGQDLLFGGDKWNGLARMGQGVLEGGNALFHASNPLLSTALDVLGGAAHGIKSGENPIESAIANVGGAQGNDFGNEIFGSQHPLLGLATDIATMRGMEDPAAFSKDLSLLAHNPMAGLQNELSRLPLIGKNFTARDAMANPEAAATLAQEKGINQGLSDTNQLLSTDPYEAKMVGVHNLSPDKFGMAVDDGGLIGPSIANIPAEHTFDQFGGANGEPAIQAVMPKEAFDPQNPGVYSYGSDAYTPTVPGPEYQPKPNLTEQTIGDLLENRIPAHTITDATTPGQFRSLLQDSDISPAQQEDFMRQVYGDPMLTIHAADGSTQQVPYTPENKLAYMKAAVERNNGDPRSTQLNTGIAPPETFGAPRFNSLDEMKQYGPNVKPLSEIEGNGEGNSALRQVHDYLDTVGQSGGKNLPNWHPFDSSIIKTKFINELLKTGEPVTKESALAAMDHLNIPNKQKLLNSLDTTKLDQMLEPFRHPVTDYIESKSFNHIPWQKIPGIVLPDYNQLSSHFGMSDEAIQQLKNKVDEAVKQNPELKVVQYDATDPNGQAKARMAAFPQHMFAGLVGIEPEKDKNGKLTGRFKFNAGRALLGMAGMAVAGSLSDHPEDIGPERTTAAQMELDRIAKEKQALEQDHVKYLQNNMSKGVTPTVRVLNEDKPVGEDTTFLKGFSNNDGWYRDFYAEHGRPPTTAELQDMAKEHLTNGFSAEFGQPAPADKRYKSLLDEEQSIKNYLNAGGEDQNLQKRQLGTSLQESQMTPNELNPKLNSYYEQEHNPEQLAAARDRIQSDPQVALDYAHSDVSSGEHSATQLELIRQLSQSGDYEKAADLAVTAMEQATKNGQAVQALSMVQRLSPDGVLLAAQKMLNKSVPEEKLARASDIASQASRAVKKVTTEAADQVGQEIDKKFGTGANKQTKSPEQLLANRVGTHATQSTPTETDPVKDMVATLYKVAKENLPHDEIVKRDPMELIRQGLDNQGQYKDIWNKAKDIVKAKWGDNPAAMSRLEDYLSRNIDRPFSEHQFNDVYGLALKESGINLGDLVKQHISEQGKVDEQLRQTLIDKAGVSPEQATLIEHAAAQRFAELVANKRESALQQLFTARRVPDPKGLTQRISELSNLGGLTDSKYYQAIADKLGIPTLTADKAEQLHSMADSLQRMENGPQKQMASAKLLTTIADMGPKSIGGKLSSLQSMAMLLNPKTLIDKIGLGHTAFGLADTLVTKGIGSLIDRPVSLLTGHREVAAPDLPLLAKEYAGGIKEKFNQARQGIVAPTGTTYEENKGFGHAFSSSPMQKVEDFSNAAISAVPNGVYRATYENSLRGQMKLANVTEPTDEMVKRATLDAQYSTLTNKSAVSQATTAIKNGLNKIGIDNFGAGNVIMKFAHVPANLISAGIDYSPVGFLKATFHIAQDALHHEGFDQTQFVHDLSRAGAGTASLAAVSATLANMGIISGKMNDAGAANRFEATQGKKDYQLNTDALWRWIQSGFNAQAAAPKPGDKLVQYNWLEPFGQNLAAGAEIAKDKGSSLTSALINSTIDSVNAATESTMFQGLQTLFNTNDPTTGQPSMTAGFQKAVEGLPASFVPSAVNSVRNVTDNISRNANPNPGDPWYQGIINQVENKLPLLSQRLAPTIDVTGNPTLKLPEGNTLSNAFMNPSVTTRLEQDPVGQELLRLYQTSNQVNQFPAKVQPTVKANGKTIPIDTMTQAKMQHFVGAMTEQQLPSIINSDKYQSADDAQRANMIAGVMSQIMTMAKEKYLGITPTKRASTSTRLPTMKSGLPHIGQKQSVRSQLKSAPQPTDLPLLSP